MKLIQYLSVRPSGLFLNVILSIHAFFYALQSEGLLLCQGFVSACGLETLTVLNRQDERSHRSLEKLQVKKKTY